MTGDGRGDAEARLHQARGARPSRGPAGGRARYAYSGEGGGGGVRRQDAGSRRPAEVLQAGLRDLRRGRARGRGEIFATFAALLAPTTSRRHGRYRTSNRRRRTGRHDGHPQGRAPAATSGRPRRFKALLERFSRTRRVPVRCRNRLRGGVARGIGLRTATTSGPASPHMPRMTSGPADWRSDNQRARRASQPYARPLRRALSQLRQHRGRSAGDHARPRPARPGQKLAMAGIDIETLEIRGHLRAHDARVYRRLRLTALSARTVPTCRLRA